MIVAVCRLSCKTHGYSTPAEGPASPPLIIRDMNSESVRRYSTIVYKYVVARAVVFINLSLSGLTVYSMGRSTIRSRCTRVGWKVLYIYIIYLGWPKINEGVWIAYNFFIITFFLFFFCKEDLGNLKWSSTQLNNVPKLLSFIFQINDLLFWLGVHIVVILMCGLDHQSQQ